MSHRDAVFVHSQRMGRVNGMFVHHAAATDAGDGGARVEGQGRRPADRSQVVGTRQGDRSPDECL